VQRRAQSCATVAMDSWCAARVRCSASSSSACSAERLMEPAAPLPRRPRAPRSKPSSTSVHSRAAWSAAQKTPSTSPRPSAAGSPRRPRSRGPRRRAVPREPRALRRASAAISGSPEATSLPRECAKGAARCPPSGRASRRSRGRPRARRPRLRTAAIGTPRTRTASGPGDRAPAGAGRRCSRERCTAETRSGRSTESCPSASALLLRSTSVRGGSGVLERRRLPRARHSVTAGDPLGVRAAFPRDGSGARGRRATPRPVAFGQRRASVGSGRAAYSPWRASHCRSSSSASSFVRA
jgi:hypothetical protein